MGMGKKAVIAVDTNVNGEMDPSSLRRHIEKLRSEGKNPFCVSALAGSTVMGGFDNFTEVTWKF